VLPFDIFSIDKNIHLGTEVAGDFSKQLAMNPFIVTPDFQTLQSVLSKDEYAILDKDRLKEIAKLLEANFIIFGSITKIQDEISIDVQVFNSFTVDYFKTFTDGTDLKVLIEDLAQKVEQEIIEKAELIPPSQRPKKLVQPAPESDEGIKGELEMTDLEAVLAKELGIDDDFIQESDIQEMMISSQPETIAEQPEEGPLILDYDQEINQASPEETDEDKQPEKKLGKEKKNWVKTPFRFNQPVNIQSDSMEYDNKKNLALFRGHVMARQGDFTVFSDTMRVLYSDEGGLKQLSAIGNVKIIQGNRIATGQKIILYNDQQKIVATGNPRVWEGDNVICGKTITVYLEEDRYVVEGGMENRASASIYPPKKKSKK
jgi:lipopolysaccharide export system protein LptA